MKTTTTEMMFQGRPITVKATLITPEDMEKSRKTRKTPPKPDGKYSWGVRISAGGFTEEMLVDADTEAEAKKKAKEPLQNSGMKVRVLGVKCYIQNY